ncbi:helix-turn-helix domain-containing protein [Weissella confusa]|uniref:helix-turn-helix domain-containing protein n=1 Tax=Weissella confusa TaxID=1583 RepID=UPI00189C18DA|nr:helix-turn-helix transcriptional regulator [Weissella confusa]MCT0007365.1 helix-turn-helix domain-containing protein [Weissella confusa]
MNRIKELRKKRNLTLRKLGKEVGISFGALGNYENERREPRLKTWKALADYFDVSVPYIQGISEIPSIDKFVKKNEPTQIEIGIPEGESVPEGFSVTDTLEQLSMSNKEKTVSPLLHTLYREEVANEIDDELANFNDRVNYAFAIRLFSDAVLTTFEQKSEYKDAAISFEFLTYLADMINNAETPLSLDELTSTLDGFIEMMREDKDN